jgi:hypothetical protein
VNTVHCGSAEAGIAGHWREGARLADGRFLNIDHNRSAPPIAAPQDKRLAELGAALFKTYVPFGARGKAGQARQQAQNENAHRAGGRAGFVQRVVTAANSVYTNHMWDLVDAWREGRVKLAEFPADSLPPALRGLDEAGRTAWLKAKLAERTRLQGEVNRLHRERRRFVAAARAAQAAKGEATLGAAMVSCIRDQATTRGYTFKQE